MFKSKMLCTKTMKIRHGLESVVMEPMSLFSKITGALLR